MTEHHNKKPKQGKNKLVLRITNTVVFILILFLLVFAIRRYYHIGDHGFTNDAQVDAFINPINVRVGGYVKSIRFREHQRVKKGDTLLILDDREIRTQLAQAEAAYIGALASRKVTSSSMNTAGNNVNVADANLAAAKARLENVEINYQRYERLLKDKSVTQQQFDQVRTEFEAQQAQYQALESQRQSSNLTTLEVGKRLDLNSAEIKRAQAALDMANLNLAYTVITAPYDGVMGRRIVNEGQLIQPGQPIASIVESNSKWVTANFLEKQMKYIHVGEKMKVHIDALDGKEYEGVVAAISQATGSRYSAIPVDNSTGNFVKVQQRIPVRIEFTNANKPADLELLIAGMNAEIKLN